MNHIGRHAPPATTDFRMRVAPQPWNCGVGTLREQLRLSRTPRPVPSRIDVLERRIQLLEHLTAVLAGEAGYVR